MTDDTFTAGDDIEAGAYHVVLKNIERKTSKKDGSEFRIWRFKTPEGVDLSGTSSLSGGPLSKTARWAKAILGRAPTPGDPIGMLYGKSCIAAVETNDEGFAKVVDVYPAAARTATPTAAPTAVSAPSASAEASADGPAAEWDGAIDDRSLVDDPVPF